MTAANKETLQPVVYVTKRNGAWLVSASSNIATSATEDERIDCAGSLQRAKQIALEMATAFEVKVPHLGRWAALGDGWMLMGHLSDASEGLEESERLEAQIVGEIE